MKAIKHKKARSIWIIIILLLCFLNGCTKEGQQEEEVTPSEAIEKVEEINKDSIILTVGDLTTTYEEIFLYMQSQKQEIETLYGNDIWSYQLDAEGTTYEDKLKEQVLKELEYIKIVCAQMKELDVSLSEDDKMDVNEYTADYISNFTSDDMEYYGFSEETVKKIYEENVLANKIYEKITLNVDTQVAEEEARHIILYYILFAKYTFDEKGNQIDYTEQELEELKNLVDEVHARALEEDFYTLAKEYSNDDDEIEIVVGRGDMKVEFENVVFALKEGEVSEVIENSMGYFIYYCKSEGEEEATAEEIERIIIQRQKDAFEQNYENWKKKTEIVLNQEIWDKISFSSEIVK